MAVVERARELMQGGGERKSCLPGKGGPELRPGESQAGGEPPERQTGSA